MGRGRLSPWADVPTVSPEELKNCNPPGTVWVELGWAQAAKSIPWEQLYAKHTAKVMWWKEDFL